jgi:hypothetical protein
VYLRTDEVFSKHTGGLDGFTMRTRLNLVTAFGAFGALGRRQRALGYV